MKIGNKYIYSALVCGWISVTSGCAIPAGGHYYHPSASYGTAVSEYCDNSVGPKNSIKMKFGKVIFILSADPQGEGKTYLNLQVIGNMNSVSGFKPDNISVQDNDNNTTLEKRGIKWGTSKYEANYHAYSFTIDEAPKSFTVKLPDIVVAGKSYSNLVVTFTYQFGIWFEVLNC